VILSEAANADRIYRIGWWYFLDGELLPHPDTSQIFSVYFFLRDGFEVAMSRFSSQFSA
jgi:hypothetical protein